MPGCLLAGIGCPERHAVSDDADCRRYSPLPSMLTLPAFAIASPTAIQAGTLATTPVGSGPFTFVEWIPGDHIQLRANANYWSSPPHVSTLTFKVIASTADQLTALQSNVVQSAYNLGPDEMYSSWL